MEALGVELVDREPRDGPGSRIAFVGLRCQRVYTELGSR
jgi:hypothetical protein